MPRVVSLAFLCVTLAGCTIVQVEGPVKVTRMAFGILRLEPANADKTLVYRSRGMGIVPGVNGVTLGFGEETVATISDASSCRLILFDPDRAAVQRLNALAEAAGQSLSTICSTRGMEHAGKGK